MNKPVAKRLPVLLSSLLPVAAGTAAIMLWVLPRAPGLAPFLAGWWVLALGLGSFRWRHAWLPALLSLPLAVPPLAITLALNFSTVKVHGESMQPTLQPGDVLLIDHTAMPRGPFGVYLIEVEGQQSPLIKRLLGMPGQSMEIRYDRLFADGNEVHPRAGTPPDTWNEDRPAAARRYGKSPLELGADELFFLGDNPPASRDSRDFGPVKAEAVKGRVVWSLRGSRGFAPVAQPQD